MDLLSVPQIELKLAGGALFLIVLIYLAWRLRETIRRSNEIVGHDFQGNEIETPRRSK
jgi:hypothetical protein